MPDREQSNWSGCMKGCLIAGAVLLVVAVVLVVWVVNNWRGWFADAMAFSAKEMVQDSDLPPAEKVDIKEQIDRVADAFREERLSMEQFGAIVKELMESPVLITIVALTVEQKYIEPSGLNEDEKTEASRTIRRFALGIRDGTISRDEADATMAHIADRQQDESWRLRDRVTDQQLRTFLEQAKSQADEAGIPDEPEEIDPSDEVKRIIDEALGEN